MEKSAIREMTMKKMLNAFLLAYVMYFNQMKYPCCKMFCLWQTLFTYISLPNVKLYVRFDSHSGNQSKHTNMF